MYKFLLRAAKDSLSDAFHISFASTNDGVKNASFDFVKSVLTNLSLKEALDHILHRNIAKWAQSSSFMGMFAHKGLKFTHFVLPVAKFIYGKVEEEISEKEEAKSIAEVPFPVPPLIPSSSETTIYFRKRPHEKHNRDVKIEEGKPHKNKHRPEGQKQSSSSGGSSISPIPSPPASTSESILKLVSREQKNHKEKPMGLNLHFYIMSRKTIQQH